MPGGIRRELYTRRMGTPQVRYRCITCGNRTRFDVYETVQRKRFEHYTLGGEVTVEDEEILGREVQRIVCHW